MAGKYEIDKSTDGQFYFRLKAGNGQIILGSERYKSKQSCQGGIESVRINSQDDAQFEKRESSSKKPYFVLKAKNHEIIGTSELYESASARDNGIRSVKENGKDARVDDLTA